MTKNVDWRRKHRSLIWLELAVLAICICVGVRFGPRKLELAALFGLMILAFFWGVSIWADRSPRPASQLRHRKRRDR
jgi:hypothetical protein